MSESSQSPPVGACSEPAGTPARSVPRHQRRTLDRTAVAHYAVATADDNPIHLEDEAALSVGLPGAVAHGMLTVAIALEAARNVPDETLSLRAVRFIGPVPVGAEIDIELDREGEDWKFRALTSGRLVAEGLFRCNGRTKRC